MDDDVRAKYDDAAASYSARYADPDAVTRFFVGLLGGWCAASPGARVLEVGCADGFMTEALVRAGYAVTAIDIAPKMVEAADHRLRDAGLAADLRVADIRTFEPTATWDVILAPMWTFFAYVGDPGPVLRRLAGAVVPGGTVIVDLNPRTQPVSAALTTLRRAGLRDLGRRPVPVPLTKRLGPVASVGLRAALSVPPAREVILRRRLNVVVKGTRPIIQGANQ